MGRVLNLHIVGCKVPVGSLTERRTGGTSLIYELIGVGCNGGKKGHILRIYWVPPRYLKNVILMTKLKTILKSVKN